MPSLFGVIFFHTIIAPSLCAPVILGLPFLAHNNIVIDHALRTAIDKCSGFDLLHPTPPPVPKPPRQKLKQFFQDIKEDQKLLVAELNMVCAERRCLFEHKFEEAKPVDIIAAICIRIETLNSQEQLD
jgi:hypothetical protein